MAVVPGPPDTIYAGNENSGVYRSVDAAMTWEQVGPRFRCIYLIADPANSARLFLIAEEGAFLSLDSGDTWTRVVTATGEPIQEVEVFTVDSQGHVYAATLAGTVWLYDKEPSWTRLNETPLPTIYSLAVAPSAPHILYSGTAEGMFRSEDAGVSWRSVGDHLTHVYHAYQVSPMTAVDPFDPDVVFTAFHLNREWTIFRTESGGDTWTEVPVRNPQSLQFDPTGVFYVGGRNLMRSTDRGASWDTLLATTSYNILSLGGPAHESNDALWRLYTIGRNGRKVSVSDNDGATWGPQPSTDIAVHDIAIHPTHPHPGYAMGDAAVFRADSVSSTMKWSDWQAISLPDDVRGERGRIWADPHRQDAMYVSHPSTRNSAFAVLQRLQWKDGEAEWLELLVTQDVEQLAADPSSQDIVTLVAAGTVYQTLDGGTTWSQISRLPESVTALVADPATPGGLYASTAEGVFATQDTAATWELISTPMPISAMSLSPWTGALYASHTDATQNLILVSADQGDSWSGLKPLPQVVPSVEGPFGPTVRRFFWDHDDSSVVYVMTRLMGAFASRDGGEWTWISDGIRSRREYKGLVPVSVFAVHPSSRHLFAAAPRGLYAEAAVSLADDDPAPPDTGGAEPPASALSALRWRFLGPTTLIAQQIRLGTAVSVLEGSPADPDVLYAGTPSGRLYRFRRGREPESLEAGLPGTRIIDLAADPGSGRLFAATRKRGVYTIRPGHQTPWWTEWNGGAIQSPVTSLAVMPTGRLIAGVKNRLLSTIISAEPDWLGPDVVAEFPTVVTHPQKGGWALAADPVSGLRQTLDGGRSWTVAGTIKAKQIVITADGTSLVALTSDGQLLRASPDSLNWQDIESPTEGTVCLGTAQAGEGQRILAGARGNIFATHDLGQTWVSVGKGLPDAFVVDLLQHTDDDGVLYAATGHGLYTTDPLADTSVPDLQRIRTFDVPELELRAQWWRETGAAIDRIGFSLVDTSLIVLESGGHQLHRSADGIWTPASDDSIRMASYHPVRHSTIGWIHDFHSWDRWLDSSDDFQRLGLETSGLAVNPRNPRIHYYGAQGMVTKSVDGGQRWARNRPPDYYGRYHVVAVDPFQPLTVYVGSDDSRLTGIFRTRDGGQTFEHLMPGSVTDIEVSWSRPLEVYAVVGGRILRTRDGGNSWQILESPSGGTVTRLRMALSEDVLYAVTAASGSHISRDAGATWQSVGGLPRDDIRDIAIHPVHAMTAYAATGSGIYSLNAPRSADGPTEPWTPTPPDTTSVPEVPHLPETTKLHVPYPNPSRDEIIVAYDLAEDTHVDITVYNVLGQPASRLIHEERPAGAYSTRVTPGVAGAGVWFVRMRAGNESFVEKILVIR
ncbi:MAG: T9SS type A sorting domain-containing protein [Gemmatimonadetes bacterium]|nr:T9SS type A sorting domain-containing protein [Gemmatimonadota bacterium]